MALNNSPVKGLYLQIIPTFYTLFDEQNVTQKDRVSMHEEILDLVDVNDHVIGQIPRSQAWNHPTGYIRVVSAFIENNCGQLWIPRRTATKKRFPLALDLSVSGCVANGESYEQALERESAEEINQILRATEQNLVAYLTPHKHGISSFMKVYRFISDTTPAYNTEDFCESYWLT